MIQNGNATYPKFNTGTFYQLLRYAIVGLLSNFLLYIIYIALTWAGMNYIVAMSILYISGTLITFKLNRNWTFRNNDVPLPQLIRYITTYTMGYLINFLILWAGVSQLNFPHQLVQAIAIIAVACFIFLVLKLWVFSENIKKTPRTI